MTIPHFGVSYQVYDGNKAITIQGFTELNSKLGNQFEASFLAEGIAPDANVDLIFQVGSSDDVLIKDIIAEFNSDQVQTMLYKNPTFTGGTAIDIYNLNERDGKPEDVIILGGATVTDTGTQVAPTITSLGSTEVGNRVVSTAGLTSGAERVLAKGVSYLYRITNTGAANSDISGVATWYQGPLSTQTTLEA